MVNFNPEHEAVLDDLLLGHPLEDYRQYEAVFDEAIRHVLKQQEK